VEKFSKEKMMVKLVDLLLEDQKVNNDFYQKVLDISNGLSNSNKQFFQSVINSVKKRNGMATPRQLDMLQRLQKGDLKFHTKLEEERQIRIYNKITDVVPGLEEFMNKLDSKPIAWRKRLVDILEKDNGYQNMVIALTEFVGEVKNELSLMSEFRDEVKAVLGEYEELESEQSQLSPKDEKTLEELDDLQYKLGETEDQLGEYIEEIEKIIESYEILEDTVRRVVKFNLKA
jgi:DNA repair exonuclease SbcCD ATPase subunit